MALLPWLARLREEVPGANVLDAHTHIGSNDPDGYRCTRIELVESLERIDARAIVFPMHEPDGYPAANDMSWRRPPPVTAGCSVSAGSIRTSSRWPRRVARSRNGARGIKLHPRAEGFNLDHPDLQDVFALADEHRLPILCHAGRGIPRSAATRWRSARATRGCA